MTAHDIIIIIIIRVFHSWVFDCYSFIDLFGDVGMFLGSDRLVISSRLLKLILTCNTKKFCFVNFFYLCFLNNISTRKFIVFSSSFHMEDLFDHFIILFNYYIQFCSIVFQINSLIQSLIVLFDK